MSNRTTETPEININFLKNEIRTIILRLDDIKAEHIQRNGKKNKAARKRLNKRSNILKIKLKTLKQASHAASTHTPTTHSTLGLTVIANDQSLRFLSFLRSPPRCSRETHSLVSLAGIPIVLLFSW